MCSTKRKRMNRHKQIMKTEKTWPAKTRDKEEEIIFAWRKYQHWRKRRCRKRRCKIFLACRFIFQLREFSPGFPPYKPCSCVQSILTFLLKFEHFSLFSYSKAMSYWFKFCQHFRYFLLSFSLIRNLTKKNNLPKNSSSIQLLTKTTIKLKIKSFTVITQKIYSVN